MAIPLHNNAVEEAAFHDLIGSRKLREIRAERAGFEAEIEEAIKSSGEIFKLHGASCNYIAELEAIEKEIQTLGDTKDNEIPRFSDAYKISPSPRDALLIKREQLLEEFAAILEKMPLTHQEDIEENTNKIVRRRGFCDEITKDEQMTLAFSPTIDQTDPHELFTILDPIFREISKITGEEYVIPEPKVVVPVEVQPEIEEVIAEEPEKENIRQVVRIKQAPDTLLNNVYPKQILEKEETKYDEVPTDNKELELDFASIPPIIETEPKVEPQIDFPTITPIIEEQETEEDISFFGNSLPLEEIIEEKPQENNVIQFPSRLSVLNQFDNLSLDLVNEAEAMVASATSNVDQLRTFNAFEDATPAVEPLDGLFTAPVKDGWSLCDLAEFILKDDPNGADGWIDIYNANFDKISKVLDDLKQKGLEPANELQHDKKIFNGLELEIPLVFTKGLNEVSKMDFVA